MPEDPYVLFEYYDTVSKKTVWEKYSDQLMTDNPV